MAMRLKGPASLLQKSVKQIYLQKSLRNHISHRHASAGPPSQSIAILGSGITGLTTAYYLSQAPNAPKITIYDSAPRVGGWLNSKHVDVAGGSVLFEQGPRSLRPGMPRGTHAAALLEDIGLADEIIFVPRDSPAAIDRWLYYPDHLVHLPNPSQGFLRIAQTLLTEPAFQGYKWDLATEILKDGRTAPIEDESIGDFVTRRVNRRLVDQVVSAVLHGIYAGDAWQLSAKSLMAEQWYGERSYTSITQGMAEFKKQNLVRAEDGALIKYLAEKMKPSPELLVKLNNASVITLKRGLQSMTERMESLLNMAENVTFKVGTEVTRIRHDVDSKKITVTSGATETPTPYDQVISTVFSKTLSKLCLNSPAPDSDKPSTTLLPSLEATPAVNVSVVNLYFSNPSILPIKGFGYLIPQATPWVQNPELALGVVFDSEITREQDTAPGTKLTVMLGGHWWDGWDTLPSDAECVEFAKSVIKRHLGITDEPEATHVSTQRDCIPQYTVGHTQRQKEAHQALLRHFGGRLKVAGNSYTGVGVNDCLMAAREVALSVLGNEWSDKTGLERFEKDQVFMHMDGYELKLGNEGK